MHALSSVLMSVTGVSARHPVNTVKPADMAAPEAVRLVHRHLQAGKLCLWVRDFL